MNLRRKIYLYRSKLSLGMICFMISIMCFHLVVLLYFINETPYLKFKPQIPAQVSDCLNERVYFISLGGVQSKNVTWLYENETFRPVCRKRQCLESCVNLNEGALNWKLYWECLVFKPASSQLEENNNLFRTDLCLPGTFNKYSRNRLSSIPSLPINVSLLLLGDSTARQMHESLERLLECSTVAVKVAYDLPDDDEFSSINLGGVVGDRLGRVRIIHSPSNPNFNRISHVTAQRLLDAQSRVDQTYRNRSKWFSMKWYSTITEIARGSEWNKLYIVTAFGLHFNGLKDKYRRGRARRLLSHIADVFDEILHIDDAVIYTTLNAGIIQNDNQSKAASYYHDWLRQQEFFDLEFPQIVFHNTTFHGYVFNASFMQWIKAGRNVCKNDFVHFSNPGLSPLDELTYAFLYAIKELENKTCT